MKTTMTDDKNKPVVNALYRWSYGDLGNFRVVAIGRKMATIEYCVTGKQIKVDARDFERLAVALDNMQLPTTKQLREQKTAIADGTQAHSIIRNGRGEETGRIIVIYSAAHDQFFSIPADDNECDPMPIEHSQDSDCTIDADTLLCTECGVDHSSECPECGGRGFHRDHCVLIGEQCC